MVAMDDDEGEVSLELLVGRPDGFGEIVSITPDGATFTSVEDGPVEREVIEV